VTNCLSKQQQRRGLAWKWIQFLASVTIRIYTATHLREIEKGELLFVSGEDNESVQVQAPKQTHLYEYRGRIRWRW